jgi:hypothetical protein
MNELVDYVLEHGLPPKAERRRILAERLAADAVEVNGD